MTVRYSMRNSGGINLKKFTLLLMLIVFILLICILLKLNLTNNNLINLFSSNFKYKELIFIILASLRIILFIPGSVFFIIAEIVFNPVEAFIINLTSIILSETILYFTSKILTESKIHKFINRKYPKLHQIIMRNNIKILVLGILCPIAPSDAACFLASSTGLSYKKFIIIVTLSNAPMLALYSLIGYSAVTSGLNAIIFTVIIVLISSCSIFFWNRVNLKHESIIKE